jgi:hypothetical protein
MHQLMVEWSGSCLVNAVNVYRTMPACASERGVECIFLKAVAYSGVNDLTLPLQIEAFRISQHTNGKVVRNRKGKFELGLMNDSNQ